MRLLRVLVPAIVVLAAACDHGAKQQLAQLAHADSLRTDSLLAIKNDLLSELMTSTQFVNDLNGEMSKLKAHPPAMLSTRLTNESDLAAVKEERAAVVKRLSQLVARLDSSQARVEALRSRAAKLARRDSTLLAQVAWYEKTVADLRQTVEDQKAEYESVIAKQNTQIASLSARVDTVTTDNVRLSGEKLALSDTVGALTTEKNTAYYVIGTKDELVKEGILVEEGHRRFLLVGGRSVSLARSLDPSKFTRIDRLRDRTITFPAGEYTIFTRQDPTYASPFAADDGKLTGGLRIDQPDRFWESSRFLVILKG
jgi:hypothetical protein